MGATGTLTARCAFPSVEVLFATDSEAFVSVEDDEAVEEAVEPAAGVVDGAGVFCNAGEGDATTDAVAFEITVDEGANEDVDVVLSELVEAMLVEAVETDV